MSFVENHDTFIRPRLQRRYSFSRISKNGKKIKFLLVKIKRRPRDLIHHEIAFAHMQTSKAKIR